jgi:hypothetical protein
VGVLSSLCLSSPEPRGKEERRRGEVFPACTFLFPSLKGVGDLAQPVSSCRHDHKGEVRGQEVVLEQLEHAHDPVRRPDRPRRPVRILNHELLPIHHHDAVRQLGVDLLFCLVTAAISLIYHPFPPAPLSFSFLSSPGRRLSSPMVMFLPVTEGV